MKTIKLLLANIASLMYNAMEMSENMINCLVKMSKKSKLDPSSISISEHKGKAEFNELVIILDYQEDEMTTCLVKYRDGVLKIKRHGEIDTNLTLIKNEYTKGLVTTAFGEVIVDLFTHRIEKGNNYLFVEYALMQETKVIDQVEITWEN